MGDPMNTHKLASIALVAIFATAASGCGTGEASVASVNENSLPAPLPVRVTTPETMDIYAAYKTAAAIAAEEQAPILARVAGQVVEILVEEGDMVRKGQILARLDGDRLRLEMLQAQANLEKMSREYDRLTNLHERGLVSATTYDGLKYDRQALRAVYKLKRLNYGYTSIRATIDGVISSRDINVGTNVKVGEIAFTVSDTSCLVSYLNIPQTELNKFSPGHEAIVTVAAMPERGFVATVARISPTIDTRTGTFRATVYVDNQEGDLAPGMFGRFTIAYEKHSNALVIPANAMVEEDNETVVYVVTDGAAIRRTIETGIRSDGKIEILSGLDKNDAIVVTGLSGLRDGSRVLASIAVPGNISG